MSYFHTHLSIWANGNGTHLYILLSSFCKRVAWEPAGRAANVNTPVKQLFMCLQFKLREGNKVVFPTFSHRLVVPSKLVLKTAISAFFMGYYWGARFLGSIGCRSEVCHLLCHRVLSDQQVPEVLFLFLTSQCEETETWWWPNWKRNLNVFE